MDYRENDRLIAAHLGDDSEKYLGAVVPPIFMNSLHVFNDLDSYQGADPLDRDTFVYGRISNPTVRIVEDKIAAMERGKRALCFASGMAATSTAILAVVNHGDHVICLKNIYGPVTQFLEQYCGPHLGITVTYVKGDDAVELEQAIRPNTSLIVLESPTTAVFSICDLRGIAAVAKKHNVKTLIDNTYCTPLYQKPLTLGIDLVMHTATKYLGGHSDIMGGVLVSNDEELMNRIATGEREFFGGVLAPMEGWLLLRGLRTLDVRLERHQATAMKVAQYLEKHPKIRKVNYPGLPSHPQYELMKTQQTGNCGLLSFELDADKETAKKLVNSLTLFQIGCSWGGFESLVTMPMYRGTEEAAAWRGMDRNTIRIHTGLEGAEVLIEDLNTALAAL